jgi:hypothetical protein
MAFRFRQLAQLGEMVGKARPPPLARMCSRPSAAQDE